MLYSNAILFLPDGRFARGGFRVENGVFTAITDDTSGGVDLGGATVIPGLVDIHVHGAVNADFSDGSEAGLRSMAAFLAKRGTTSLLPTSMTLPYGILSRAFATALSLHQEQPEGIARIAGIHMEGPFFCEKRKGGQNGDYLRLPDFDAFRELYDHCRGLIRIVDAAPELAGAAEFAREAAKLCTVSAAHTDADYESGRAYYEAGATHLTHLFNCMPPIGHRSPGLIGAASERGGVTAELICDGLHVQESAVRMAFKLFPHRICLVSDALRCCGMPDGTYELGGQTVYLKDGIARLDESTIAGSAVTLHDCLCNAIRFGIPREEAILAATARPAKVIGQADTLGAIAVGHYADFLVCNADLSLREVYLDGKRIA